jgi:hypothetical protein
MNNATKIWRRFQALIPKKPVRYGYVASSSNGTIVINMDGGGTMQVVSTSTFSVGTRVKLEGVAIVGQVPALTVFATQEV